MIKKNYTDPNVCVYKYSKTEHTQKQTERNLTTLKERTDPGKRFTVFVFMVKTGKGKHLDPTEWGFILF